MENIEIRLNILYQFLSYSPHLGLHNMHDKLSTSWGLWMCLGKYTDIKIFAQNALHIRFRKKGRTVFKSVGVVVSCVVKGLKYLLWSVTQDEERTLTEQRRSGYRVIPSCCGDGHVSIMIESSVTSAGSCHGTPRYKYVTFPLLCSSPDNPVPSILGGNSKKHVTIWRINAAQSTIIQSTCRCI